MKNIILRINRLKDEMSSTQASISKYIIDNPHKVTGMTVRELAKETYTSPSSVIRLIQMIGLDSFNEFKQELLLEINSIDHKKQSDTKIQKEDSIESVIEKVTASNIQSLQDSASLIDKDLIEQCVNHIIKANTVLLFGIGASFLCASDAFLKFVRLNKRCLVAEDWHTQLVYARSSSKDDVALVFSYSGNTTEMIECIKELQHNQTPVYTVTRYASSPISKMNTYNLFVASNEEVFRKGATSSRITQLNIIDIIFTLFINKRYDESLKTIIETFIDKTNTN